ncbi:hypothetical protein Tco_0229880, partial [Tanacetum coccineum]
VIPAHTFELPPSGNIVIDFVNELGYLEPVEIVSNIKVNYVYQPWRAILSLVNQAVMGRIYLRDPDIFLTQTTTPVKQSKPAPPPTKKPSKPQQESAPQEEGDDPDLELAKQMSLEAHQEKKEGEGAWIQPFCHKVGHLLEE